MSDGQRTWVGRGLNRLADQRAAVALNAAGLMLPCKVVSVASGQGIVTVQFQVQTTLTLPNVTVPVWGSKYIRLPLQPGDTGFCTRADARLGGVSGLGLAPSLATPSNLGALCFVPCGNNSWSAVDGTAVTLFSADGTSQMTVGNGGITLAQGGSTISLTASSITLQNGTVSATINAAGIHLTPGIGAQLSINDMDGFTGTFGISGGTVTVNNGIIIGVT